MSEESALEVGRLYVPIKAIADTLTAAQKDIFVRLPALIAYWPMGIRDLSGNVKDHSGALETLTQVGTCETGYDGNSFVHLGNGTNYLNRATGFGITGLETWVTASLRGLTLGGWFMVDTTPTTSSGLISKDAPAANRGYSLTYDTADQPGFNMSGTGAAILSAVGQGVQTGQWHFIVGRFIPSTEVAVIVDGDKAVNTTAIPASEFVSSQPFEIGRFFADNNRVIHGKVRDVFVCAAALSDALIEETRVTSVP